MLTPARRVRSHSAVNSEPGSSSCPSPGQPREPVIFPVAGNCVGPAGLSSFPSPGHFNKRPSSFSALSDGNPLDDGGGKGPPLPHHPVAALRRAAVLACCPKMKKTPLSPCYSTPIEKVRFGSIRIGKKASMRERPKELRLAKEEMFDDDSPTHVLETVLAQDKTKKDDGQRDSLLTGKLSLAKSFRRKTRRDRPLAQSRNPAEVEVVPLPAEASRILTIEMDVTMRFRHFRLSRTRKRSEKAQEQRWIVADLS
ncbi:unnamed protein product, partial [Mesorhabditis belari]|uniref:Uncharacterized protein n=1 Tax=Mesorhabditis belari TaxID=2138241 RepID=A0AAF3EBQ7_9BILA